MGRALEMGATLKTSFFLDRRPIYQNTDLSSFVRLTKFNDKKKLNLPTNKPSRNYILLKNYMFSEFHMFYDPLMQNYVKKQWFYRRYQDSYLKQSLFHFKV